MKLEKNHIIKMIKSSNRDFDIDNGLLISYNRIHGSKKDYNRNKLKQQMKKEFTGLTW